MTKHKQPAVSMPLLSVSGLALWRDMRCLLQDFSLSLQRGECVLVVGGAPQSTDEDALDPAAARVLDILLEELPVKQAAALAARITGVKKNRLYQLALEKGR